jgi:plasmid stability protein
VNFQSELKLATTLACGTENFLHNQCMKSSLLLLIVVLLSSCQTTPAEYHAHSVAEARAYARRAVEIGVIHKGGEAALVTEQSAGLPLEGKWNPQKIDNFLNQYAAEHPRLMEINKAATVGKISEKEREILVAVLKGQEERMAEEKTAEEQEAAAELNQSAAMINQSSSYRQNSALLQATPTSQYSGFGTGFGNKAY